MDELRKAAVRLRQLASEVRLVGDNIAREADLQIERYPPDSAAGRKYRRYRDRVLSSCRSLVSLLEAAASSYEGLLETLTAPPIDEVLLPVYLVETRGKARRRFLIANLRFKRPGLVYKLKDLLGRFDSLFDETELNRKLAILEEEGFVDDEYIEAIADLISKSLL